MWLLFKSCGKGWLASTASGVSIGKNLLLKIAPRPGGAFRTQFADVVQADVILPQERLDLLVPERILLRHHLVRYALNGVENFRRAHPVGPDVARLALDLLLDAGDANLEEFIEIRAHDPEKFDPLEQRLGRVLRFFQDAAVELEPAQLAIDEISGRSDPPWPAVR